MSVIANWSPEDDSVISHARALAMDAVQKVGNGHPGTAMSLAPVAYLLFQKHLVHDPRDPQYRSSAHGDLSLQVTLSTDTQLELK